MQPEAPKLLEDVRDAAAFIRAVTTGKTLDDYLADRLLRQGVERNFELIGEALNRLGKRDSATLRRIPDHAQIIAFRNVLIHGYDAIDDHRVWDALEGSVPNLLRTVEVLLREAEGCSDSA